jgi:CHASE3 domain sensor protein
MLSSRVTGGLAALLAVLVIAFVVSVHGASRLAELGADVAHSRDLLDAIGVARATLREMDTARRGYHLTRDNEFLELYLTLTKESVAALDRLRDLTADDPAQRRRVDSIAPLVAHQLTVVTEAIAASDAPSAAAAAAPADEGAVVAEQIHGLVAELETAEQARLREREAEANARTVKVIRGFAAVALVALLLLGAAYYVLDRDAAVHAAVLEELRQHARTAPVPAAAPSPPARGGA